MLQHFDIRPVQRADGQRTVKGKLHVTGAGRFRPRRGDLLREIGRRNDQLREADAVVRNEHHLQLVADIRIVVDHLRHIVDEVNDVLRHVVGGRRLTGKDLHTRHPLRRRIGLDAVVVRNDVQHVHQLALVLVNTLDLHVEQRFRVRHHVQMQRQPD